MYVDVCNRSEIFRNLKSVQGLIPDYNDQTNLSKLACVYCKFMQKPWRDVRNYFCVTFLSYVCRCN